MVKLVAPVTDMISLTKNPRPVKSAARIHACPFEAETRAGGSASVRVQKKKYTTSPPRPERNGTHSNISAIAAIHGIEGRNMIPKVCTKTIGSRGISPRSKCIPIHAIMKTVAIAVRYAILPANFPARYRSDDSGVAAISFPTPVWRSRDTELLMR